LQIGATTLSITSFNIVTLTVNTKAVETVKKAQLSVTIYHFMLSVIRLSAIVPIVVAPK
jgi:hypothetical protein